MCSQCPAQRSLSPMFRNVPKTLTRLVVVVAVLALIRELSIRKNSEAMVDWPRQGDTHN